MTDAFTTYLTSSLEQLLRERRIVVFYDPRSEFEAFVDELPPVDPPEGRGGIPRVWIKERQTHIARYEGSFFALKLAVEPIVELDKPDPLLVYVPGVARDHHGSVLMELEKAGTCYEPQLRRLARNELRRHYTDGEIDEMLAPEGLSYRDVARLLSDDSGESGSMLKLALKQGSSEAMIAEWLAAEENDALIEEKGAKGELYKLVDARLGLAIDPAAPLGKARHLTIRYVLVNEFRGDLSCAPPPALALVPATPSKEQHQRVRDLAELLRRESKSADAYAELADKIEEELGLAKLELPAGALGSIDTFCFEERVLLAHAAELVADGKHEQALAIVADRGPSFWLDRDVSRRAQWEACRLVAELGREVARVRPLVKKVSGGPERWVEAYTGEAAFFEVDRAHRALETWVAAMDDDPEERLEKALGLVRRAHESLLKEMALGYSAALAGAGWNVPGVLHQTRIYPEHVERAGGRVAYFFVDAMRYEMGADLARQLDDAQDLALAPAIAALPSITHVGMAALLPGASASFSVVEHKGKLASRIDDMVLPSLAERQRLVRARRPDAIDLGIGVLLDKTTRQLAKLVGDAPLVIVRSQSIDKTGETDGGLMARQIMEAVLGNIARAVRRLAKVGITHFVITADHGHQFSVRKEPDMIMDRPMGETIEQHRRAWAGRGGQCSDACVRVSGAELGYDTDLDFIFPKGLAVFAAGGDLAFHHGGISLQEMVVPVLTLRMPGADAAPAVGSHVYLDQLPPAITNRMFSVRVSATALHNEPVTARVVLIEPGKSPGEGAIAGQAGMAMGAQSFDKTTSVVQLTPGTAAQVGMMLVNDRAERIRVVVQDPHTDAVLVQSEDIPVKLGLLR